MAYTKQTWLDRVGTFLNRFTKTNETLSSVELVNNPGTITQAGTAFSASRMNYMESGIEAAHRIATPLSDLSRAMQINGDGVPMIPDNVAGEVYRSNFSSLDGWFGVNGGVVTLQDGYIRVAVNNLTYAGIEKNCSIDTANAKIVRIKFRYVSGSSNVVFQWYNGSYAAVGIASPTEKNGMWQYVDFPVATDVGWNGIVSALYIQGDIGSTYVLDIADIYIGSGLYDTPVYDKACCNRFTNNGVLPVKGNRGLALSFNGAQYLQADNPIVGISGTLAVKLKNITSGILAWNESYNANGFSLFKLSSILAVLRLSYNGNNIQINIPCTDNSTMCICFTNGSINIYVDSRIVATSSFSNITQGTNNLRIGAEISGASLHGTLEDIRYDTAIWTQDDAIRYHNGDDAVDSQQKSVTPVPHSIVTRDANGGINASNMFAYDLVIDSDAKLAAWAASGNWEKVLIKKGTWTLASGGVDLTARGTKCVIGEPGSELVFSSAVNGLYYTSTPTTKDYRMDGVSVECTGTGTGTVRGFYRCTNMTNCTGTGTGTGTDGYGFGFSGCTNIINCTGTGTGAGFVGCTNIINCIGTGTGTDGYGFVSCKKCQQNTATGSTAKYNASYADSASAYACADTPNGGFNS